MVTQKHWWLIRVAEGIMEKFGYNEIEREQKQTLGVQPDLRCVGLGVEPCSVEIQSDGREKWEKKLAGHSLLTIDGRRYSLDNMSFTEVVKKVTDDLESQLFDKPVKKEPTPYSIKKKKENKEKNKTWKEQRKINNRKEQDEADIQEMAQ